jgi:hypothetical protein
MIKLISHAHYRALTQDAKELERDGHGVKVLLLPNQKIIKLFRVKQLLSLSLIYPYSLRFAHNAKQLIAMGIPSVAVEQTFFCLAIRRHGLIYPLLEGESLDKLLINSPNQDSELEKLTQFMAQLHQKGVLFRSLHLGNILRLSNGHFGLIDVADIRFHRQPLNLEQRRRNFRHLFRNPPHRLIFEQFGIERFIMAYLKMAGIPKEKKEHFLTTD